MHALDGQAFGESFTYPRSVSNGTFQYRDFNGDGKADLCRRADGGFACTVSTGRGVGDTHSASW